MSHHYYRADSVSEHPSTSAGHRRILAIAVCRSGGMKWKDIAASFGVSVAWVKHLHNRRHFIGRTRWVSNILMREDTARLAQQINRDPAAGLKVLRVLETYAKEPL